MTGPWRKYQQPAPAASPSGPWDRYRRQPAAPAAPADGDGPEVLGQLNRGIMGLVNAPGQAVTSIADMLGYGDAIDAVPGPSLNDALRSMGVAVSDRPPEGLEEHVASGVGEAAGALIPFGAGARALSRGTGTAARVADDMMQPFVRNSRNALAAESAAGAGAGAGRYTAEETGINPTVGEVVGGVAGGMSPQAVVNATQAASQRMPVLNRAIRAGQAALFPGTDMGGKARASERIRGLAADPEAAGAALDEPSVGGLSPAQRTGDRRLMALERQIGAENPQIYEARQGQLARSNAQLRGAAEEIAEGGNVADTRAFLGQDLGDIERQIREEAANARARAQQRLDELAPANAETENAAVLRAELEAARERSRQTVREAWAQVPQAAQVAPARTREMIDEWEGRLSSTQKDAMPAKARAMFRGAQDTGGDTIDPDDIADLGGASVTPAAADGTTSVKEMLGLYSEMRKTARQAGAAGEDTTARIAGDIADTILEDLEAVDDAAVATARAATRQFHDTYSRGTIGRVLGSDRRGGSRVAPERTAETVLGATGSRAAVQADELRAAVGDSAASRQAEEDYLRRRFTQYAQGTGGQFDNRKAERFLQQNDELLDRYPDLKRQMQDATIEDAQAVSTAANADATVRDLDQAPGSAFLSRQVGDEVQSLYKARDPREAAQRIMDQVRKDSTGAAEKGLKRAIVDDLLERSRTKLYTDAPDASEGDEFLSGARLQSLLRDEVHGPVVEEVLGKAGKQRLQRIAAEMRNVEAAAGAGSRKLPDVGETINDPVNSMLQLVTRWVAANQGGKMGSTSGSSLQMANFASRRMQRFMEELTNGQARRILYEAVDNPELYRELVKGIGTGGSEVQRQNRLVETMIGVVGQQTPEGESAADVEREEE